MNPFQSAFPIVIAIAIYTAFMRHVQSQSAGATTSTTNAPITKYSTIIMGAGMSGISAAKTLYDAGERNFIVLEAQDYIGGRTKTVQFGGLSGVNVGCSWFTGGCYDSTKADCQYWSGIGPTETNPLFTLATQNGYSFLNTKWSDLTALGANGNDETNKYKVAEGALGVVWECIYDMGAPVAHNMTLSQALDHCGWHVTDSVSKSVAFHWFSWGNAINFDLISANVLTLTSKELYGNQDLFVNDPRGFQGITELVATDFIDKIRLNAPIKTVAYDTNDGVTVTLDNGEILSSDYGIITFSLGVLQSDLVTFSPPVPTWKSNAWNQFGMSHFSPILIKWPYDFWTASAGAKWWYILNDDRFGYYIIAMNLHHQDLYKDSLIWRIDLVADVSIEVQKQNISQIQADIVTKVSLYFDHVPQPEDIIIQKWSENVYIRGSYMYWPPKSTLAAQEQVKRNLDGVLYFAGEHTVPDNGYVHSAYFSGISAADEVLQSMSTSTTTTTTTTTTKSPTKNLTQNPSKNPTQNPTNTPTQNPTNNPTQNPSKHPTQNPTQTPTQNPTNTPTQNPSKHPTQNPTQNQTNSPALSPTSNPTEHPTFGPTIGPTIGPPIPNRCITISGMPWHHLNGDWTAYSSNNGQIAYTNLESYLYNTNTNGLNYWIIASVLGDPDSWDFGYCGPDPTMDIVECSHKWWMNANVLLEVVISECDVSYSTTDAMANTHYNDHGKQDKREHGTSQMVAGIDDHMLWIISAVIGIIFCCFCAVCVCLLHQNRKYKRRMMRFTEIQQTANDNDDVL